MQIRHSYSIGSIVPFSSSTTFTSTNENKDSSECISYRPGPHSLTCKYDCAGPAGRGPCRASEGGDVRPPAVTPQRLDSARITNIKHTHGWKESSACLYWSELRDGTTGYGVFGVFLRGVQGTEMVYGSRVLRVPLLSIIREVSLCRRVHTARRVRCSTPSCCP